MLKETIVRNDTRPWDGIGHKIDNGMSVQEIMTAADLDWDVIRQPTYYEVNGKKLRASRDVLYRPGHEEFPLTEVPPDWKITQNREAFEFFENWVNEGKLRLISAGSLYHGRLVWVLAEIGDGFSLFKNDVHKNNILFTLPHMYGRSIDVKQTPLRIWCNNQIAFALRSQSKGHVKWDHRRKFNPEEVRMTLSIANRQFMDLYQYGQILGSRAFDEDDLMEYVQKLYPVQHRADSINNYREISKRASIILENMEFQPGVEEGYGTWWQAFQGVSYCINHVFGETPEARLEQVWHEKGGDQAIRALKLALEYATK